MELSEFTRAFADGLKVADASRPIAVNQRSGAVFQPGIGPHTEKATVGLVLDAIGRRRSNARFRIRNSRARSVTSF